MAQVPVLPPVRPKAFPSRLAADRRVGPVHCANHPVGVTCGHCVPGPAGPCKHGDPYCPCQDWDPCHYEGNHPMQCPTTHIVGCLAC